MHRGVRRLLALTVLVAAALAAAPAHAADVPVWRAAETRRAQLLDVQTAIVLDDRAEVADAAAAARRTFRRALRAPMRSADRDAADAADAAATALDRLQRDVGATPSGAGAGLPEDAGVRVAAARGEIRGAVFRAAYAGAVQAAAAGDADEARAWLLVREFRTATRFTRPGADATRALADLANRRTDAREAAAVVRKDLLDAYQARLRELLDDVGVGVERRLPERQAEAGAQADQYFQILRDRFREDRGADAATTVSATYADLAEATADRAPGARVDALRKAAAAALDGFTAAPLTGDEAARRAQQLLQFLALVPVEYGRGVSGTRVTKDFEIQEAVAFQSGAEAALDDLRDTLAKRDQPTTAAASQGLEQLGAAVDRAAKTPDDVEESGTVESLTEDVTADLRKAMPAKWKEPTDESDYDLIDLTLDRLEASAAAGQYQQAEQARLEAYAFFEFGPERRLQAFDPGLALDVEGLIWFGAADEPGLARLIARRAPLREIKANRKVLDTYLQDAAATLGDSANATTVITNSAIIVFREGLEAVLILAAITASFVGARRRLRRPVLLGAGLGLLVSVITWVLAQTLLRSLERYGEKLEAIVGLIAIGVLLLITNWFFHRVYWSEWIAKFHRQRKKMEKLENTRFAFLSAQVLGLGLLGLTSVYREGFETVLFLQSLQLSAGTATVLEGAGLGLALTLGVAVLTFALQRKLPYKRMLVVTGVMIGFVLVVMVGQTARTMQGTGWLPITSLDVDPPYWLGLWFGVYPTVETIGAQVLAMVFVIGSFFLAREVKVKRPQRKDRRRRAAAPAAVAPAAPDAAREPVGASDER